MKKLLFLGILLMSALTFGQTYREFTPNKTGSETIWIVFKLNKDTPVRVSVIQNGFSFIRNNIGIPQSYNKNLGVLQFLCDKNSKLQINVDNSQIVSVLQQNSLAIPSHTYNFGLLR